MCAAVFRGFNNYMFYLCAPHRDSKHPEPPPGTKWKEVRHDNKVTWLVSWTENIQGSIKYIMLNPSSRIKVGWQDVVYTLTG